MVDEFCSACTSRKLKVIAGKSEVMVFERREAEVADFNVPFRMSVRAVGCSRIEAGNLFRAKAR